MMRKDEPLTAERLRALMGYDAVTGRLWWLGKRGRVPAGTEISRVPTCYGYLVAKVDGSPYPAHRLAWLHHHGRWPHGLIDHINGDRTDNRIVNLREASWHLNGQNRRVAKRGSSSGYLGVTFVKKRGRYRAAIALGEFDTAEEAYAVYVEAKRRLHAGNTL